ncbi:MAG: endonuclease III domain-containing protein [Deltaproteobacteria bacterium]|nr:endonuclease III domain-containing protein [Deltaproteobacteria bacterium]
MSPDPATRLHEIYHRLFSAYGPQHWWPAKSRFEVILGAILTQNTNWKNVERAITNLRKADLLRYENLRETPPGKLAELIRPSGYYNIKTKRLRSFCRFLQREYDGNLSRMFRTQTEELRRELLAVPGIGPETADSILLYAAKRPVFVVDAYTHRVLSRHGLCGETSSYEEIQSLFMDHLDDDVRMFNEYHALFVRVGKLHCTPKPRCDGCPLDERTKLT